MAANKKATCIVIDVGRTMSRLPDDGGVSQTEKAVKATTMFIRDKIFFHPKDEVALVLFGSQETANALHDGDADSYQHVVLHRPMELPGLDLVRFISHSIVPSDTDDNDADVLDALLVAMDTVIDGVNGKKIGNLEILMFTDAGMPFRDDDQTGQIIKGLQDHGIKFSVVGIDADIKPEPGSPMDSSNAAAHTLRRIATETGGATDSLSSWLELMAKFQKKLVNPTTTFRGPLEIGSLQIGVEVFNRQQAQKPISFKKVSNVVDIQPTESDSGAVDTTRTYHKKDDEQTEVDKDELIKGISYGEQYLPWDKLAQDNFKVETEKCLQVLEFVPHDLVPRHVLMGEKVVSITHTRDDPHAATALSALCNALEDMGCVAVVRFVFRKNAAPILLALWPHVKLGYECLLGARLPYLEDMRTLNLSSLEQSTTHATSPEQLQAMGSFIDKMDLMSAYKSESGIPMEALRPKDMFNPALQRQLQCIEHRALNPEQPLPELDASIKLYALGGRAALLDCAADEIDGIECAFPLKNLGASGKASNKKHGRSWKDSAQSTDKIDSSKRARTDDQAPLTIIGLLKSEVLEVGDAHPAEDYRALCEDNLDGNFESATKQLQDRIQALVQTHLGSESSTDKFASCVAAMREYCARDQSAMFNTYLLSLKDMVTDGTDRRRPLWDRMVLDRVTLITDGSSSATPEDAARFLILAPDVGKETSQENDNDDDDDPEDLLDDL